jgi:hypothetical protein
VSALLGGLTLLVAQANPALQVGAGKVLGGWEFVWASYGVFWGALALYGLSLWSRSAAARRGGVE